MSFSTSKFLSAGFFSTVHVCTYTQHDDTLKQEEYQSTSRLENADEKKSNKRNWHLFCRRPQLLSRTLTLICYPGDNPVLCGSTQRRYTCDARKRPRSQAILAADSGFHFGPRAMRFIQSRLHDVLLGKPWNFIFPASSNFIVVALWYAASSSHAAADAPKLKLPSRASKLKLRWLTEKIKKKKMHT